MSKEDTMLLTISTEGLMLKFMIDVVNGHGVAHYDIPVDFLQTDYNKGDIHIKMEGEVVTLLRIFIRHITGNSFIWINSV